MAKAKEETAKTKATGTKAKATGKKAKEKEVVVSTTFGIDAMVDAIAEDLQGNIDHAQSVREISKKAIKAVLKSNNDIIQGAVANGDKVAFIGFGTYEPRDRAERKGRNPQTGEEIVIEAKRVPAFSPGKAFKDAVK